MEAGLPSNAVHVVRQTRDGYLWIGTGDGLVRFDGVNFEIYNMRKIPRLKSNDIRALYEDREGTLWIGTDSGGLTYYKEGEFVTYPVTENEDLDLIRAIEEDSRGNIWIGSRGRGLTCLISGKFTNYKKEYGLPHNKVSSIYKDGNDDLWVTTRAGIVKIIKPGCFKQITFQKDMSYFYTTCLYEEDKETLWIGTFGDGLFRLKNDKSTPFGVEAVVPHPNINFLYKDKMQNLWIGTEGGGLIRMSKGVFSTYSGVDSLAGASVYSIDEDREDSLWVGTLDGGLHQLRDSNFTTYTSKEGLTHDIIHSIYEDKASRIWIGTDEGLNRLENGKITNPFAGIKGISDTKVLSFFEDSSGTFWIGTENRGLYKLKDGKRATLNKENGLSDNKVTCIYGDQRGNTWIGTADGLNMLNNSTGKIIKFNTEDGLTNNKINFIFKDSKGNLWIGTVDGLNCLKDGIITPFKPGFKIENKYFHCAYEGKKGTLWFGCDSGLIRRGKNDTIQYTMECGLNEDTVQTIHEDKIGYLWLGGPNGISRIRKKELEDFAAGKIDRVRPDSFNESDGMKSRWCNGRVCETQDGRFWFPTYIGVSVIDPNRIKKSQIPPEIIIEKVVVDGESLKMKGFSGGKKEQILKPIELSPGKKRFEFYYTAVSFINPRKIRFKLRLVGYDKDWVDRGNLRSTNYTELAPGRYTFEVKACNPDGEWNEKGASFSFYLKPYFYETTWFILLAVLFVILGAFSFYRFRVRQLRAREKELSELVALRTKDLRKRNSELEKARREIQQSKEIIEEKNRHITDSMRYARRIQQAMLPIKEKMSKELKDYFVIYRPKDIVSGDFYWFDVLEEHYFLAVADCTGHGVPGALLSMIGYMMLNEAIVEKRILDPAEALSHLHQGFRSILKQEIGETETYDGMDVALCRIDKKTGKITFAGARRPLLFVRESELIEVKGDRKSIGGRQKEEKCVFTNREIEIPGGKKNEIMLYLTTDGFADQNNPRNKKYGSGRLKQFLQQQAHLNAVKQEAALIRELKEHMAGEEQRDDITITGIRVGK